LGLCEKLYFIKKYSGKSKTTLILIITILRKKIKMMQNFI